MRTYLYKIGSFAEFRVSPPPKASLLLKHLNKLALAAQLIPRSPHHSPTMPFYYQSHGKAPPNQFVAFARRIYNPLGFHRGYNFPLWIIFGLGALAFCASRAMYFDFDDTYKNAKLPTGDWEYQSHGRGRIGILLHLAAVIPIGFLLPWQFLPIIRYKFIIFHRLNGYLLILLLFVCDTGAILVGPGALGGTIETRLLIGVLTISTVGSAVLAYINIKRLQIDQHRAWMLRCWAYAFNIISLRLIQLAALEIVSRMKIFYASMECRTIDSALSIVQPGLAALFYPQCAESLDAHVAVLADAHPETTPEGIPRLDKIAAASQVTFAMSGVMALLLHAFAVEVYLHLTQHEANRLKRVSRERQIQRGWSRPGDASWLTGQIWGDFDEFDYTDKTVVNRVEKVEEARGSSSEAVSTTHEGHVVTGDKIIPEQS